MIGFPARGDVQIGVIAQNAGSLHRRILIFPRQFLQAIERFLIDKKGSPDIEGLARVGVRACAGHQAVLC